MRKKSNKQTGKILAASVLGMMLSVCVCVNSSFAWFVAGLENTNVIQIGWFEVEAQLVPVDGHGGPVELSCAAAPLPAGYYELRVRGKGNTPGYALIFLDAVVSDYPDDVRYTERLTGKEYTYYLMLNEPADVWIEPVWAEMEGEAPLEQEDSILYGRPPQTTEATEEPSEEQSVEPPAEQSTEQPVEEPAERPSEQPTEQPTEQPVEQPAEQPVEQPTGQPEEQPEQGQPEGEMNPTQTGADLE